MELIESYKELPTPLRYQLKALVEVFADDPNVRDYYRKALNKCKTIQGGNRERLMKRLILMSILMVIPTPTVLEPKFFSTVFAYNDKNAIYFSKCLKTGRHVKVMEGKLKDTPVIVKWYESHKRDTSSEVEIYSKLNNCNCPRMPWYKSDYQVWDAPVLVVEKLKPLTWEDNEYKLGYHILSQLECLHRFGVHCDLKPLNIMKRAIGRGEFEYTMIDFGGVTTEKLEHGYRRWLWSPKWTSQKSHEKRQICTAKEDLIELGFVMKAVQNWKVNRKIDHGEYKRGYHGRLLKYMKYVGNINPTNISSKVYRDLMEILSK